MPERDRWSTVVAGIAVVCWSLSLATLVIAASAGTVGHTSWPDVAIGLAYPAVALLVAHVREARRWSALTLMSALFSALNVAGSAWADRLYRAHIHPTPGASWAAWVAGWSWVISIVGFVAIAYFPDGRLPSRRWRIAPAVLVIAGVIIVVGNAWAPRIDDYGIVSPLPGPHVAQVDALDGAASLLALVGLVGCLASVVARFRRADPVARRQIGWYMYGYGITLAAIVAAVATNLPTALIAVGPVSVAAGAAIGILRYRLYDIDRVVNATLTWGLLSALVIALYIVSVGFFERVLTHGGSVGGLVATGIVAVAFQPLRTAVQRVVNQLIYGYRDQPAVVFRALAATLEQAVGPDAALAALPATLAGVLRLPVVVLEVDGGPGFRAAYASAPTTTYVVPAAAAHNGGTRVEILAAARGRAGLAGRDRQLLASLAPSLAAAAEAVRLNRALETATVRAVSALAEEQRRMRRDLHDGLGPVLAGLRLTVGSARKLLGSDPAAADRMLADAQDDAVSAMDDVRRLAHDLRPPALDELGLAAALRDRLDRIVEGVCTLDFVASAVPDVLPAAVEVAAYRIGCEAVLNAVRHAEAVRCTVSLEGRDGGLTLSVADDGIGMASGAVPHVGLRSMRERAEELGGTIEFDGRRAHGTVIRVWLPCRHNEEAVA